MSEELKPQARQLMLEPMQLAALLVLDAQVAQLQVGANQLGGFLKLHEEADILVRAAQYIQRRKEKLMDGWGRRVQLVGAGAMPPVNGVEKQHELP